MLIQLEEGETRAETGGGGDKIPGVHVPRSIREGILFNVHSRTATVWTCWVVVLFKFLLWHIAGLGEGSWNSYRLTVYRILHRHHYCDVINFLDVINFCDVIPSKTLAQLQSRLTVYRIVWRHHLYDVIILVTSSLQKSDMAASILVPAKVIKSFSRTFVVRTSIFQYSMPPKCL